MGYVVTFLATAGLGWISGNVTVPTDGAAEAVLGGDGVRRADAHHRAQGQRVQHAALLRRRAYGRHGARVLASVLQA